MAAVLQPTCTKAVREGLMCFRPAAFMSATHSCRRWELDSRCACLWCLSSHPATPELAWDRAASDWFLIACIQQQLHTGSCSRLFLTQPNVFHTRHLSIPPHNTQMRSHLVSPFVYWFFIACDLNNSMWLMSECVNEHNGLLLPLQGETPSEFDSFGALAYIIFAVQ